MKELYVVIGKDLTENYSWICEYEYNDGYFKQLITKTEALEFVKEFDDLVESGGFEYKIAKLTFLD